MKRFFFVIIFFSLALVSCKTSKQDSIYLTIPENETVKYTTVTDITEDDIRWHVSVLASDSMRGRKAGTPYEALAAKYIKENFNSLGLKAFSNNYFQSFPITTTRSETQPVSSQNVISYLNINDSKQENEYIVIGAHYDHIGTRTIADSLLIRNGADDNASGVAGLLEIAEKLCVEEKLMYNVIFAAFGAEEIGLIGSNFFCDNPPVPLEKIKFMINLDMIGRMDSLNHVYINPIEFNNKLNTVLDEMKDAYPNLNVAIALDYYLQGSDHASFYNKNIPSLSFTTGLHNEYHTPADTIGSINYEGEKLLLDFVYNFILKESEW